MVLSRDVRHQAGAQISRDTLGSVSLGNGLEIRKNKNAERGCKEFNHERCENQTLLSVVIDGVRNDSRNQQVQTVAEDRYGNQDRDQRPIGL